MRRGRQQRPYAWLPWLLAGVLMGNLAGGVWVVRKLEARLKASTGQTLTLMAADVAEKLDQALFERYTDSQAFAHVLGVHVSDPKAQASFLNMIKDTYLYYRWLGVMDARGRIIAATDPSSVGEDRSKTTWFQAVRDRRGIVFQNVTVSLERSPDRVIVSSAPITGPRGEFLGAVTALISMAELEDTIGRTAQVYESQLTGGGRVEWSLVALDGTLIADSVLRQEGMANLQMLDHPSAKLAATGEPGYVEEAHGRRPFSVLTGYARTAGFGEFLGPQWIVLMRVNEDELLTYVTDMKRNLGLAGGLMLTPVVGLLLWSTNRLRTEWMRVQDRHRDLVHTLDAIVWEGDPATFQVTYVSPQVERLLGYSPEQWVNNQITWQDLIHSEDVASVFATCKAAVEAGRSHALEYRMRTAEGRIIWVKDLVTVTLEGGRPGKLRGILVDITKEKEAEAREREGRADVAAVIGSAMDAIITMDEAQRILMFNVAAEQIFRCPAAEAIGQPLDRFIPARFRDAHREHVRRFGESGITQRAITALRADGEEFPAEASISQVEVGGRRRYTVILRDVSEQVRRACRQATQYAVTQILAEAMTLQEAAKPLLEALCDSLDYAFGAFWSVDGHTQTLRCVETWHQPSCPVASFETVTRQSVWAPGVGLPGRVWATGLPAWVADIAQDENMPRAAAAAAAGFHGAVGFPILLGRGMLGVLEFFSGRIAQPDQELLQMLAAIGSQIGVFVERTQAQSKAWVLLQAIEASVESVMLVDLNGVITYGNPAAGRMFGYDSNDLIGRFAGDLYPENIRAERLPTILAAARETGWSGEVPGLRKDGTRFPRWVLVSPTRDAEGRVLGLVSVSRDLTETKLMEAQAQRLERLSTLGQLMGGIAHELKNPLFILTGRLQLLDEKLTRRDYASVGTDMEKIEAAAHRMTIVAERFLSLARPVAPRLESCAVDVILQEVLEFLANELMKNQIRVERAGTRDLPRVMSDPEQLHEVFLNLIINAMQAMVEAHGRGTLTVVTARVTGAKNAASPHPPVTASIPEGDWIEVKIQDDGPGIAPEHRARLFEPFFSTKPPGKGTGLGLWAVRSITMGFKGTATYETEVGRGTTFIIRLPVTSERRDQESGS